ncbi:late competence protein ComER [Pontibacillus sp. ALD_SL1]|uniref:late competence protein ComER n=1 Tax=Pontibacillus sp. ALD_SL1 TaxID=2777185 RepID=UPI001A960EAC|nr:late competence protein ComER [Pontibacillus sp. ALD_SL1]QSS99025.1 late competence protein ComER [Pontibacillus sp. ALD_SL1]
MKWGIIGTGNMGKILTEAWIDSGMIEPEQLYVTNRTLSKAKLLQKNYPGITVCEGADAVAKEADMLFICVKPLDIYPLLNKIQPYLTEQQCLVSITSPYSVEDLEHEVPCQVVRWIPSITNRAQSGVTLLTFGERVSPLMKAYVEQCCKTYSKPVQINENVTRVSSDIVSCGPAFFSYLLQRFVDAACEETKISEQEATTMVTEMLIGFGKLLEEEHYSLPTLQEKVCVKGGVTGEGIEVLETETGKMFHHLFQRTHRKYNQDKWELEEQKRD